MTALLVSFVLAAPIPRDSRLDLIQVGFTYYSDAFYPPHEHYRYVIVKIDSTNLEEPYKEIIFIHRQLLLEGKYLPYSPGDSLFAKTRADIKHACKTTRQEK